MILPNGSLPSENTVTQFLPSGQADRYNAYYIHDLLQSGHTEWAYMPVSVRKHLDPDYGEVILLSRRGAAHEILNPWEGIFDAIEQGTDRLLELGYKVLPARLVGGRVKVLEE